MYRIKLVKFIIRKTAFRSFLRDILLLESPSNVGNVKYVQFKNIIKLSIVYCIVQNLHIQFFKGRLILLKWSGLQTKFGYKYII